MRGGGEGIPVWKGVKINQDVFIEQGCENNTGGIKERNKLKIKKMFKKYTDITMGE